MRDVMPATGLRRPSFTNTLSEFPEVEESSRANDTEEITIEELATNKMLNVSGEGEAQLPPISDVTPSRTQRPRLYIVPERSSKKISPTVSTKNRRFQRSMSTPDSERSQTNGGNADKMDDITSLRRPPKHGQQGRYVMDIETVLSDMNMNEGREKSISPDTTDRPQYPTNTRRYFEGSVSEDSNRTRRSSSSSDSSYTGFRRWSKDSIGSYARQSSNDSITEAGYENGNTNDQGRHYRIYSSENVTHNRPALTRDIQENESFEMSQNVNELESNCSQSPERRTPEDMSEEYLSKRRWSRPSFAETTRKASLLIRAAKAVKNKKRKDKVSNQPICSLASELSKNPRFSSFMSAEAQFALMKGYEDILYDKLSQKYPEYNGVLKRNKTPSKSINIRRKSSIPYLDDAAEEDDEGAHSEIDQAKEIDDQPPDLPDKQLSTLQMPDPHKITSMYIHTLGASQGVYANAQPSLPSSPTQDMSSLGPRYPQNTFMTKNLDAASIFSEPTKPTAAAALRNLRRLSSSLENGPDLSKLFEDEIDDDDHINDGMFSLHRYSSLPSVCSIPNDRRLVLSQRLENAMDIIDVMKSQEETLLSPRIKNKPRNLAPLSEYNRWSKDWSREFKINHGKA